MATNADVISNLKEENDRLKADLREVELRRLYIDTEIGKVGAGLQKDLTQTFASDVTEHRKFIEDLYKKFEKFIYTIAVVIVVVIGYLGYQVHDLPGWIEEKMATAEKQIKTATDEENTRLREEYGRKWAVASNTELANLAGAKKLAEADKDKISNIHRQMQSLEAAGKVTAGEIDVAAGEAESFKKRALELYGTAVATVDRRSNLLQIELVKVRLALGVVRNRREVDDFIRAVKTAATEDWDGFGDLLTHVEYLSSEHFAIVRGELVTVVGDALKRDDRFLERRDMLRAALLLEEPAVGEWVENGLGADLTSGQAQKTVSIILNALESRRRGFSRFIYFVGRGRSSALVKRYQKDLLRLSTVKNPIDIAIKAVLLLDFGELSTNDRKTLNGQLVKWATANDFSGKLVADVLKRMPLDEWTGRLYAAVLKSNAGGEVKTAAANRLVRALRGAGATDVKTVMATIDWNELQKYAYEPELLSLLFARGEGTAQDYVVTAEHMRIQGWKLPQDDRFAVGSLSVTLPQLAVEYQGEPKGLRVTVGKVALSQEGTVVEKAVEEFWLSAQGSGYVELHRRDNRPLILGVQYAAGKGTLTVGVRRGLLIE